VNQKHNFDEIYETYNQFSKINRFLIKIDRFIIKMIQIAL